MMSDMVGKVTFDEVDAPWDRPPFSTSHFHEQHMQEGIEAGRTDLLAGENPSAP